jgi:hypothetical protein
MGGHPISSVLVRSDVPLESPWILQSRPRVTDDVERFVV